MAAAACAALHLRADYFGPRSQTFVFKPATLLLIIGIATLGPASLPPVYKYAIVAALLLSLCGDFLLLLERRWFVWGLTSFLGAHLCYLFAFWSDWQGLPDLRHLLPLILWTGALFWLIRGGLGRLYWPVIGYIATIAVMMWIALERGMARGDMSGKLALAGALLFGLSDTLIALARFRRNFHSAQLLILSTYYVGQWLLALSVVATHSPVVLGLWGKTG